MSEYQHLGSPLDRSALPQPVFAGRPDLVEFYWRTWELAWDHVVLKPGAPQSPYIDEAFDPDIIWIWDTCFMVLFCRYAPHVFPGIQSLDNFYVPLHDGVTVPLLIRHVDNPPLFAWVEHEHFLHTGDRSRLEHVYAEKRYLQKHFEMFESFRWGMQHPLSDAKVRCERTPYGYRWAGVFSGMDNSPRDEGSWLWFDAAAQQALAARSIVAIGRQLGDTSELDRYERFVEDTRALLDRYYWNEADGYYYDISPDDPGKQHPVPTPATYWPLLAGLCSKEQAARLAAHAASPQEFGGPLPWTSLPRSNAEFRPKGNYWRGGIWLPTAYMATRALLRNGYHEIADTNAAALVDHMARTWREYEPHTVWECYSPTAPRPSSDKDDESCVRGDFCGWSALGPIALFIENVLGFYEVDVTVPRVCWRLDRSKGPHGIRNLRVGGVVVSLVFDGAQVVCETSAPLNLLLNSETVALQPGRTAVA